MWRAGLVLFIIVLGLIIAWILYCVCITGRAFDERYGGDDNEGYETNPNKEEVRK